MENAADALKMAFAVIVFAVAVTVLFYTASLVRSVSESVLFDSDKTTYYTYYEGDETTIDENGNRIVTLEDIIPTMYRYHTESAAVTLIDEDGEIITRFDRQTETLCTNWNSRSKKQKMLIIDEINFALSNVHGIDNKVKTIPVKLDSATGINEEGISNLEKLFRRMYGQNPNTRYPKKFDCPWNGLEHLTAQRIDSDLSGIQAYFSIRNPGQQINLENEDIKMLANHIPCHKEGKTSKGIIHDYKNARFTEYLVLHDTNNYITDEEDGDRLYAPRRT